MYIKLDQNSKTIKISDEAKTLSVFYIVLCIIQMVSSSIQVYHHWNQFKEWELYVFLVIFILHAIALVFFIFYNSKDAVIKNDSIKYFNEKRILGIRLGYIKLKNNKVRLLNFKKNSDEIKALKAYFTDNNLTLKS